MTIERHNIYRCQLCLATFRNGNQAASNDPDWFKRAVKMMGHHAEPAVHECQDGALGVAHCVGYSAGVMKEETP